MARLHAGTYAGGSWVLLLAIVGAFVSCQPSPDARSALLAQRRAILNWDEFSAANGIQGWNLSDPGSNVCTWGGIECSGGAQGNVTSLILACFTAGDGSTNGYCAEPRARGTLAPELATIRTLASLFIFGMEIFGTIPDSWLANGSFPSLAKLYLSGNSLTGTLPSELGNPGAFPALEELALDMNELTGSLPANWSSNAFPSLTYMNFGFNRLQGTLPGNWATRGSFPALQEIHLCGNAFTGGIPAGWGTSGAFPTLITLAVCDVPSLGGTVPSNLGNDAMPQLEELYLHNTALTGTLPPAWAGRGSFSKLKTLELWSNSLSGSLPSGWGSPGAFPKLETLYLYLNPKLNGSLPGSWGASGSFPSLQALDLHDAKLTGTLPPEWGGAGALPSLATLNLTHNRINGTLPESWGSAQAFQNLTTLSLDNNDISGSVPPSWGDDAAFPKLNTLYLQGDGPTLMCGPIPEGLKVKITQNKLEDFPPCSSSASRPPLPLSSPPTPPSQAPGQSPPPAPLPAPPGPSSSSAPVGAIVGGIAGGLGAVVLGVLAFLAFRRGKCWLRKQARPSSAHDHSSPGVPLGTVDSLPHDDSKLAMDNSMDIHLKEDASRGTDLEAGAGPPHTIASVRPHSPPSSRNDSLPPASIANDLLLSIEASSLASRQAGQGRGSADQGCLQADVAKWVVPWDQITLIQKIGKGSFGQVYTARWNQTLVAAKVLSSTEDPHQGSVELPQRVMAQLKQEAGVMVGLRHPNIVQFLGLCTLPPCILTEYCRKGSLYDLLRTASKKEPSLAMEKEPSLDEELTWERLVNMALDAALGILYLHSHSPHPIIHRDIKSPNLLVDKNFSVKVSDFNVSKLLAAQPNSFSSWSGVTNPTWLAPEVLRGVKETTASDVYSFGLVMLELLTWQLPWAAIDHGTPYELIGLIVSGRRPKVPALDALPCPVKPSKRVYKDYCALMRHCWAAEPNARPKIAKVVTRLEAIAGMAQPGRPSRRLQAQISSAPAAACIVDGL